jgi:hypothetical protein
MVADNDVPVIRDEPLPALARAMVESLRAGPRNEERLREEFGDGF